MAYIAERDHLALRAPFWLVFGVICSSLLKVSIALSGVARALRNRALARLSCRFLTAPALGSTRERGLRPRY